MVLIRVALVATVALAAAACNQSLFDNHGKPGDAGGGGDDDDAGPVPMTCAEPCAADAAGDFNGSAGGASGQWRYLEDRRDRTWLAMTGDAVKSGADPGNQIAACNADAAACKALPGALLISSAGATSAADPAIELTLPARQVIQLTLRAYATGNDQTIRLYRNSREDALITAIAVVGTELAQTITLDTIAGDRFLVAVAPEAGGGEVALELFANPVDTVFPASCQIALSFATATGNTVENPCGPAFTHALYSGDDTPPVLAAGPFAEHGMAGDFSPDAYFKGGKVLDRTKDTTTQLWVKQRAFVDSYSTWLFSDIDLNNTGGLSIGIIHQEAPLLDIETCETATRSSNTYITTTTPYPTDQAWHFVRVVHTGGKVKVCLDGKKKAEMDVVAGFLKTGFEPYLGADVVWSPQGAFFDGELDDVRVVNGALPCD